MTKSSRLMSNMIMKGLEKVWNKLTTEEKRRVEVAWFVYLARCYEASTKSQPVLNEPISK